MSPAAEGPILVSMFLTGLAGSLHCIAMCGPILLGFCNALGGHKGKGEPDFLYYHAGRLWTYGLLGLLAGWAGAGLRHGAIHLGWQRPLAILVSLSVMGCGMAALGLIPNLRLRLSAPGGCLPGPRWPWLAALLREPRPSARLLLGAMMGLLPCGLVYAVLIVAATLPHPLLSALGMVCFGAGTLPALSILVLGGRLVPRRLRASGTPLAAAMLIAIGLFMLARTLWMPMGH